MRAGRHLCRPDWQRQWAHCGCRCCPHHLRCLHCLLCPQSLRRLNQCQYPPSMRPKRKRTARLLPASGCASDSSRPDRSTVANASCCGAASTWRNTPSLASAESGTAKRASSRASNAVEAKRLARLAGSTSARRIASQTSSAADNNAESTQCTPICSRNSWMPKATLAASIKVENCSLSSLRGRRIRPGVSSTPMPKGAACTAVPSASDSTALKVRAAAKLMSARCSPCCTCSLAGASGRTTHAPSRTTTARTIRAKRRSSSEDMDHHMRNGMEKSRAGPSGDNPARERASDSNPRGTITRSHDHTTWKTEQE